MRGWRRSARSSDVVPLRCAPATTKSTVATSPSARSAAAPWQCLKRLPLPQGHGALRAVGVVSMALVGRDCMTASTRALLLHCAGMSAPAISRYPVPALEELPDDIRARIVEVQQKAGFVPNVFVTLAHRPDEFRAFFAYHDAPMLKDGGLTKAEREMIVVATSSANDCLYCVVAHGAILR